MNKIKCSFCDKQNLFKDTRIRTSGKARLITCEYCHRAVTVGFKSETYYEVVKCSV